jgi:hypothetical protein
MKKLFFFITFLLIALSGYSQKQNVTSETVLTAIKAKIGKGHVLLTDDLNKMIIQYNNLRMQEAGMKPEKDMIADNPIGGGGDKPFCFFCRCTCQGDPGSSSSCTNAPITCSGNCSCGCPTWNIYISMCVGGKCNW